MTIDPTRKEWLEGLERIATAMRLNVTAHPTRRTHNLAEAALGCPCPPEPPPEALCRDGTTLIKACRGIGGWWVYDRGKMITPDEAVEQADALREHARYAREQEEKA